MMATNELSGLRPGKDELIRFWQAYGKENSQHHHYCWKEELLRSCEWKSKVWKTFKRVEEKLKMGLHQVSIVFRITSGQKTYAVHGN